MYSLFPIAVSIQSPDKYSHTKTRALIMSAVKRAVTQVQIRHGRTKIHSLSANPYPLSRVTDSGLDKITAGMRIVQDMPPEGGSRTTKLIQVVVRSRHYMNDKSITLMVASEIRAQLKGHKPLVATLKLGTCYNNGQEKIYP
ncbi:hypothetical protein [Vibrio phage vB_VhaS-a]|nr:hypothetical protein [Vibrio phage vB_VhaS-a]